MTERQRRTVEAVVRALDVPRDRLGRLRLDPVAQEPLRLARVAYRQRGLGKQDGDSDVIEQAVAVLRAMLEDAESGVYDAFDASGRRVRVTVPE
jgi:hypothetical protein